MPNDQRRVGELDRVGEFMVEIVGIQWHRAGAHRVQREKVPKMLRPILQNDCDPMADAVAGVRVSGSQLLDDCKGLPIAELGATGEIVACRAFRNA